MPTNRNTFWRKAPFIKLLAGLINGILTQWYYPLNTHFWWLITSVAGSLLLTYFFIPFFSRYQLKTVVGCIIFLLFTSVGGLLTYSHDVTTKANWFGHRYSAGDGLVCVVDEPPQEKENSFRITARVSHVIHKASIVHTIGKIILYVSKDAGDSIAYGNQILLVKPVSEIKNASNPGGFNFKRYAFFHGITHQAFLKLNEFKIISRNEGTFFSSQLHSAGKGMLKLLAQFIDQRELGLAEALLIGYKDDLDKSLLQSYANTGVVHIIAISGLHLGIIYWILVLLFKPFQKIKKMKWPVAIALIACLWAFSLIAGAQPSITRAALMFTCIIMGDTISRKSSIFNTIAFSAFILLLRNPYNLWDIGFQLSYAAVLSIVIFMRPIYNLFYVKNKLLDLCWKMNAVTLSAQILTLPLCIYYFHQFPNYFLLTNFVAVPLSSIILVCELALCVFSFLPFLATAIGDLASWLIRCMNNFVMKIETFPYAVWEGLQISVAQGFIFLFLILSISLWLMNRISVYLKAALIFMLIFLTQRSISFFTCQQQQKIIVYNLPKKTAVDFITGRKYLHIGDSDSQKSKRTVQLASSRTINRTKPANHLNELHHTGKFIVFNGKTILFLDTTLNIQPVKTKPVIDLLIISRKPFLNFSKLSDCMDLRQVVFDSSIPFWKLTDWKSACDSLQIRWHDVTTDGAFEINCR